MIEISCYNGDYAPVFNQNYFTIDITISLIIYVKFSMIIKLSLFNLSILFLNIFFIEV